MPSAFSTLHPAAVSNPRSSTVHRLHRDGQQTSSQIRQRRATPDHTREVQSVDYNPVRRDSFLTSSWDDIVKLWTLDRPTSIRTFKEHAYCGFASTPPSGTHVTLTSSHRPPGIAWLAYGMCASPGPP